MKIAIAGYGLEGKTNYEYFKKQGEVTIVDERQQVDDLPVGVETRLGSGALEHLDDFDIVVRTAGLAPHKIRTNGKVWSATNEFFSKCPAPIIGVTGSKGKGTTASFIASILKVAGRTVHLVGNIGTPALSLLDSIQKDDIVVFELSSFQLWDIISSPHVAVVLMIEADHLDVHKNMEEYVAAKQNIVRFQSNRDIAIYNAANDFSRRIGESSKAKTIPFPASESAHIADEFFWYDTQKLCPITSVKLPGDHNLLNACAAIDAAWQFTQDTTAIEQGLLQFEGLPHRLKFVRKVNDVDYYDDSIATTPGSAIGAIKAFDNPKILILGGSSKGAEYQKLAMEAEHGNVKAVIVIGDEAPKIEQAFIGKNVKVKNLGTAVTMPEIVDVASLEALAGDIVILSPACASFGMFKGYADRGDQFIAAVNSL